ncbi:MAG: hypothetical protein RLZZ561_1613 [Pseudomonadota bacterium]|jgi:hypothetical protein
MSKVPKVSPTWVSPLTDDQHAQLGRLCVLWGQIDFLLDHILEWTYFLREARWDAKFHKRPFDAKLSLLRKSLSEIGELAILGTLREFCGQLDKIKGRRNHAVHGIWGWRAEPSGKMVACARHQKSPSTPLKPSDFDELEQALCFCSNIGGRILLASQGQPVPQLLLSGRFFHGGQDQPPEFVGQWQNKYPWDSAIQDPNCKEGQLPRPARPLPEN